ncbi:MAG: cytidylate kinase-like family protein [Lachnospiraceae bacterium]|nr:cytidylate kinase-like family protein [Lachnospiraceae bacterium]
MKKVITISREFGSGGRTIGRGFFGIEKAVALIIDAVGGAIDNE